MSDDLSTSSEAAKTSIDRLIFFSDAVVAIAMTLLALELPVPKGTSAHEVLEALGDSIPEYLAFLISFFVISTYWRGHHRTYRYVTDASRRLIGTNSLWLLAIVLTPYATKVLYSGGSVFESDFPLRFGFYALVQAFAAGAFMLSNRAIRQAGLLDPAAPPELLESSQMRGVVLLATFLVSIPVAFLVHVWAFVVWGLLPVWMRIGARVTARRTPEPGHPEAPA